MTGLGGRPDHVVYVCLDPGVPVFGRKGCSVHVQAVLRELLASAADVDLVTCRPGGDPPPELAAVRVHDLGRPAADDPATRERLLVEQDRRAAAVVAELLSAPGRTLGRRPLVYQRYALFGCETMEAAARLGAPGVLEVNAPLLDEQARHRVLVDSGTARERTVRALRAARLAYAVSSPVARWAESLLDGAEGLQDARVGLEGSAALAASTGPAVPVAPAAPVPALPVAPAVPVVPNGVAAERFTGRPASGPEPGEPLTVAFVGTFRPWHGLDLLLDAAARLQDGPGLRLLLVGDGPQREATLARARAAGVPVEAPGAVEPDRVPELLGRAHAAVAPYPAGPGYFSPLKVAEYLAAGLPTVASAVGDLPALLADGWEALLVPPGDGAALATALRRLRDEPGLRHRLSRAGRAAAVDRLTWRAVTDRVFALAAAGPAVAAGPPVTVGPPTVGPPTVGPPVAVGPAAAGARVAAGVSP